MANRDNPSHQGNRTDEIGHGRDRDNVRDDDLSRKQREGNLGNERNRDSERMRNRSDEGDRSRDRRNDASRLPE
jgi:hypothetical protein